MAQVSKYPISEKVYERCWEIFLKTLVNIKNFEDAEKIISDLLTPTERIMFAKRLAIAYLLSKDYEYREISRILRVSSTTISMVNLSLKHGSNGYKQTIEAIVKDEEIKESFSVVAQNVLTLPATINKGSGVWRYLKHELEKTSSHKKPF